MNKLRCVFCDNPYIANKTYCLCDSCNYKRLHDGKSRLEVYLSEKLPLVKLRQKESLRKRKLVLDKDAEFYKICFDTKIQRCEECGEVLPMEFKDQRGNLIAIYRYSHILTKGAYPEHRHDLNNINILCLKHHKQWEFGDRESMNIFSKNQKIIEKILSK